MRAALRLALAAASAMIATTAAFAARPIVANGRSEYSIVIEKDASPSIRNAAREIADDIDASTGVTLPVVVDIPRGPAIYVGCPQIAHARLGAKADVPGGPDAVRIVRAGRDLFLLGANERGVLYACYRFLEDQVGVRWYAPEQTLVPHRSRIDFPASSVDDHPAFVYRDTDIFQVTRSGAFDAHVRLNGGSMRGMDGYGGINRGFNGAENFYELVPPSRYFAAHPEYYSLIGGRRSSAPDSQLCLTNPDVFQIVVDALVAQAQASPALTTLGLSPNDAYAGNCQCDACKEADARLGGPAGTELDFINKVAAAVDKRLPDRHLKVETLAYQYTEQPPAAAAVRPASNVLVCVCPISACIGHDLAGDATNTKFRDRFLGWAGFVGHDQLQVWHYAANFRSYLQPLPDWSELGTDFRFYHAHNVGGVFVEGDYQSIGEMNALRTWLVAKLLWNPDQDVWTLVSEFCNSYYGKAGPDVVAYLHAFSDTLADPRVHVHIYDSAKARYLTPQSLAAASAALDKADADADSDTVRFRLREIRFSLEIVDLERTRPSAGAPQAVRDAYRARLDAFVSDLRDHRITQVAEPRNVAAWYQDALKEIGEAK